MTASKHLIGKDSLIISFADSSNLENKRDKNMNIVQIYVHVYLYIPNTVKLFKLIVWYTCMNIYIIQYMIMKHMHYTNRIICRY